MSKLTGHVNIELIKNDDPVTKLRTIAAEEFELVEGGEPVVKDGETSTWYLFKYIGDDYALAVDFVEVDSRIFSYELKSEFLKKDFRSVEILEDELDFSK
jgi:hypothetical protein